MEYDRWYTLRIQMDPQTAELSYYLDGQLLDRFQPTNVDWLMKQKFGTVQKDLKIAYSTFTNYATYRCPVNTHKTRLAG
jgi:hypothetical protein